MNSVLRIMTLVSDEYRSKCCNAPVRAEKEKGEAKYASHWFVCEACGQKTDGKVVHT